MSAVPLDPPTAVQPALPPRRFPGVRAWNDFVYLTAMLPLGIFWIVVLSVGAGTGLGLLIVIVGFPILILTVMLWRGGADLERQRAALVLGAPIPDGSRPLTEHKLLKRSMERLRDPSTWRDLGYLALLSTAGLLLGTVVIAFWSAALAGIAMPLGQQFMSKAGWLGSRSWIVIWSFCLSGFVIAGLTVAISRVFANGWAQLAQRLLGPDPNAVIQTLQETRAGAVESSDATLRRIERDLHDGAQHRLAYIAMTLGRAQQKLEQDPDGARELLAGAHDESKKAMTELRDLVRGIHPSVLTDRGLDAAISGIAGRCPVPVAVQIELGPQRPPLQVETAAYFVVAEALTNVGRHSGASHASVDVVRRGDRLIVEVSDDGHGGAARAPGSGLEGLAQRLAALDGTLTVESPDGGPTAIRAELPCVS